MVLRKLACYDGCPGAKVCPDRSRCAYARLFEPVLDAGPSGLADPPRPFVLRPHLPEGRRLPPGTPLTLDVHVFDVHGDVLPMIVLTLNQVARAGLGPGRARAELVEVRSIAATGGDGLLVFSSGRFMSNPLLEPVRIELETMDSISRIGVEFTGATELKAEGAIVSRPEFWILVSRVRDRVATLDRLYGDATVSFDWKGLATAAESVSIVREQLRYEYVDRRSSRTGQTHPLGGFMGSVEYAGAIRPFLGLLRAGEWTGVGRQTVWGQGAYKIVVLE